MKYMVSCRQPINYLKEADEIRVYEEDLAILSYLIDKDWACTADIIVYITSNTIPWEKIDTYKDLLNIIIAPTSTKLFTEIKNKGYKYFWAYPITSFWELNGLINMGVSQALLDGPMFFSLEDIKNIAPQIEIRLIANECFNSYIFNENGIMGTYIRPEDIKVYENYVNHIEFKTEDLKQERALVKIYKNGNWPGNLNLLLNNLNYDIDNRPFNEDFALRRINCHQKCQEGKCRYCEIQFHLISAIDKNYIWIKDQMT